MCSFCSSFLTYYKVKSFGIRDRPVIMVNILKFQTFFFLFSNKMLVFRVGINKLLVRIANREDPDQTASLELSSKPFRQVTCVQNFIKVTVNFFFFISQPKHMLWVLKKNSHLDSSFEYPNICLN